MPKLRLVKGEIKQISGPVTGQRYTFVRSVGHAPVVDVDERDYAAMLREKAGCCNSMYRAFEPVE